MNELLEDPDLENPDSNTYQAQFSWDEEFQKTIVSFLMSDRTFLLHSIDLIKPTYFTSKAHQKACEVIFNHYKKYRYIPSQIELVEELKKELKGDKYLIHHLAEIKSLYDYFEPNVESRDYLTDKLTFFAKIQSLRQAFSKSLKQIDKNPESEETWSKVYDLLREAMNTDRSFDVGLEYFNTLRERYDKMHEDDDGAEYFKTGYEDFDREIKGGGYIRGEVLGVVGGSGVGKSILMSCIGAHNLKVGKNVLYISLELTEARVAERFDSILTDVPIYSLYESRDNVFERLEEIVAKKENKNMLLIKQFPSASADVNTIRAYMSQLKFYGFRPDVVIIDYIGEMKDIPGLPTHESRERTVKELRGLAGEEQVFMVTAFQPNRGSKELQENNGVIEEEHLADSFGQIRPLDGCLSINQNKNEKSVNIGRMWVIKQRNGKSRYMIYLKFHPQTLQITEIHHDTYRDMNSRKKEEICQSVEDQMLEATVKPIEISKEKIAEMAFKAKNSYQEDGDFILEEENE